MSGTAGYIKGKAWVILLITVCTAGTSLLLQNCSNQSKNENKELSAKAEYTGDASCAGCHSSEHKDWLSSHHYMAMLPASDTTVLGDFNDATLTADGVTSSFFKKEGKYFINTEGDDGQNHNYEVKYTFGFYPLQQYLVEFPGGRMQVPRVSWDSKSKKWYHQYAGMQIPAHDWLHWTGNSQNWNTMCASCHSTNLQKGYDWNTDTYNTTYNIVNVSCESCHGPGSRHIELVSSSDYKKGASGQSTFMLLGKNSSQSDIVNTCGVCHARKTDITGAVNPGKEFLDDFIPQTPTTEYFHADGQMDDEVYNYTSFLQSKMHKRGVKCTDCHNPHSGKVMPGNISCGKCHEPSKYDAETHTFHKSGTAASECKSCHMYAKEYMGNDLRHDHSFRIPRPDLTAKYGTPNTCNSCHSNKSPQWAASAIARWYGPQRKYHFSEDLIPGSRLDETSFMHLQKLLNDTAVPPMVHATAAEYLGNIPSEASLQTLLQLLNRSEPHVRYRALRSLETFDASLWISEVTPLLTDPVKAVRIAAATLTSGLGTEQIPAASQKARQEAEAELEKYVLYQTDFAAGNSLAGDYYTRKQSYSVAEKYYQRAIGMDDQMNYARLNLSAVLSSQGKNSESLKVLNDAIRIDPSSERAYYNKALLLAEMNDLNGAAESFEKAVRLNSRNTRVYYNYGIILQQLKRFEQAESILLKGITLDPINGDLNYSLCLLYLNTGQKEKAKQPITVLLQYHYDNPAYAEITNRFSVKK